MASQKSENEILLKNLIEFLSKGNSHVLLDDALKDIPFELLNKTPENLPYNLWQMTQHIRISQKDILNFCCDPDYKSPEWPEGYWPANKQPSSKEEWESCVEQIKEDRESFIGLLKEKNESLCEPFDHGNDQSLLREALVLADHNAYHTAEIIVLRRLLGNWKK
ncbi:MAG: DinB family protein [Ginsengibacter sp.]